MKPNLRFVFFLVLGTALIVGVTVWLQRPGGQPALADKAGDAPEVDTTLDPGVEPDHDDAHLAAHQMLRIDGDTIARHIRELLAFELPEDTRNVRGSKPDPATCDPDYDGPEEFFAFTLPESHRQAFLEAIQKRQGVPEPSGRSVVAGKKYGLPFTVGRGEYGISIEKDKWWVRRYRIWYDETNGSCYMMWYEGKPWE
jgi:hypothetical protein